MKLTKIVCLLPLVHKGNGNHPKEDKLVLWTITKKKKKSLAPQKKKKKSLCQQRNQKVFSLKLKYLILKKNVINKNIEERKQMEKQLGISNIAAQVMKTKPKTFSEQLDDMVDSDSD